MDLDTPIREAGKLLKLRASLLEKLGIATIRDLLFHIPFRYDDFSLISKIKDVQAGETVTVQGTIIELKNEYTKRHFNLQKGVIEDETGTLNVTWFNQQFITRILKPGDKVSLSGKIGKFIHTLTMESPEYENINSALNLHTGRFVPVYPETAGLTSKWLRRQMYNTLRDTKAHQTEYLPEELLTSNRLLNISDTLEKVHFPNSLEEAEKARMRLAFEELFFLQITAKYRKSKWQEEYKSNKFDTKNFAKELQKLKASLPFTLTNAQENSLTDIFSDLSAQKPMNRLLQGDVGSGKTVVAAITMYLAHLNGFQSILMAPTEILANQHFLTIKNLLEPMGLKISIATGSKKLKEEDKDFHILVGTHAVLSEKIVVENLGLAVIDEQQRFGVEQRATIRNKGKHPHLLTMTATPIPRTVALTLYGDLDLSYLDELPKGRQIIKTWVVLEQKRLAGYEWIKKEIRETNSQVFIICPFIEESENMKTVKAAAKEFERLQKDIFPDFKLGLLHGRMKGKEKDQVLKDFKEKKFDILVATPVVEVGIDIPNATIMVIEAAERFGLAQLHQLRGRVGRGDKQSYCLLFTDIPSPQILTRLRSLETMHNGAALAELDFKLRGPGEIYGTSQHGAMKLKVATFSDTALITQTKEEAEKIYEKLAQYPKLLETIKKLAEKQVSPD